MAFGMVPDSVFLERTSVLTTKYIDKQHATSQQLEPQASTA